MSNNLVIVLISDQTIPNVQFIKWYCEQFKTNFDLLFVSTNQMEQKQKSENIKNGIKNLELFIKAQNIITVDENDLFAIQKSLEDKSNYKNYKNIFVSITGGNKLMSLAAFRFFSKIENTEIYYQPIGKTLQKIHPEYKKYDTKNLSLEEFFASHGITYKYDNTCVKDWNFNKTVYDLVIKENREQITNFVKMQNDSWFKNIYKRKDFLDFTQIDQEKFDSLKLYNFTRETACDLIKKLGFDVHNVTLTQIRYITGGWFEEYVYQKICNEYENVEEKNVALNVYIQKGNDKNELDIVYLDMNDKFHIVECKSFVDGEAGPKVLNDALYKAQAIMKTKFGLFVQQHLFTKSIIEKETPLNRAKEFGIDIKDGRQL